MRVRLFLSVIWLLAVSAQAAEITEASPTTALIEGVIKPGDAEKLSRFLRVQRPYSGIIQVELASRGGSLKEAMKIGRLVRKLNLSTLVPSITGNPETDKWTMDTWRVKSQSDFVCASACFFVFIAGINRDHVFPMGHPVLGIHRPYLVDDDARAIGFADAMKVSSNTRSMVESYLVEMGVDRRYVDRMYSTPKDEITWISERDFEADFQGFTPQVKDWVAVRCDKRSVSDRRMWEVLKHKSRSQLSPAEGIAVDSILAKMAAERECGDQLKYTLAKPAIDAFIAGK